MLSPGDVALVETIRSMNLSEDQLALLASRPGWGHLGLSRGSQHPHCFVTILLSREQTPESLYEQLLTLGLRVPTLKGALCVMEFVPHSHAHLLMDRPSGLKVSNLIRSIKRALALPRLECVDVVSSKRATDYANRVSYLHGTKVDPSKQARVSQDEEIRDAADIPHIFSL